MPTGIGPKRSTGAKAAEPFLIKSLNDAIAEQGLSSIVSRLKGIVPDLSGQYSLFSVDSTYLETKVRGMHAFQMSLIDIAIRDKHDPLIVDIGDSSGTHIQYIKALYGSQKKLRCLSVNLDKRAIERIKAKGLDAIEARVEELHAHKIDADVFLCFETLEHLTDPVRFLYELSQKTRASTIVITVPFIRQTRVGLHHIRNGRRDDVFAENTHIFELSGSDLKLIAQHAGWGVQHEQVYLQYPLRSILRLTRPVWKRMDFEGFYGLILKRDGRWASKYKSW